MLNLRWKRKERVKENILHKATELFLNLGFKSVTMDDIANEMGISKKTIYANYSTKTKLVEASTNYLFDGISYGIESILERRDNPIEELYKIKQFVMQHLKGEKTSPIYQLQKYYPEIHAILKSKQLEMMEECVVDNLHRGVDQGLFRKEIPVDFISRIYFSGVSSIKDNDIFPELKFTKKSLIENHLEYHLRGICTQKGLEVMNQRINQN